jgi:hypothetical protein
VLFRRRPMPTPDPRRLVAIAVGALLAGAAAFGLWHLLVGGLVNGNPRAAGFGLILAIVAGAPLSALVIRARRRAAG